MQHIGDLTNPSFLELSPDQRFLCSVHGDGDYASTGKLASTGQVVKNGSPVTSQVHPRAAVCAARPSGHKKPKCAW
jgi:hypothetical protein